METEIITTLDGSTTIRIKDWNECYHSTKGAIQEAYHVFIKNGLEKIPTTTPINILEIGFGTALNAFITFLESKNKKITYTALEAYPITPEQAFLMNYVVQLNAQNYQYIFEKMHQSEWEIPITLAANFTLHKQNKKFQEIQDSNLYNLIYFDAFAYSVQPELWSNAIFNQMFIALKPNGILVTYAARGVITRAMQQAGFRVTKVAGPAGKREMTIAFKDC